jgi:hypothetical protein
VQVEVAGDAPSALFGAVEKLALSDPLGDYLVGAFRQVAPEPQMVARQGLDGHARRYPERRTRDLSTGTSSPPLQRLARRARRRS